MAEDIELIEENDESRSADPTSKIAKLKSALEACEKEKKEYLEGWQRAKADLINYKKDEVKKLEFWRGHLENELIREFFPVLDSFDLALSDTHKKHLTTEAEKGFLLIRSQFLETLRRFGVEEMKTVGTPFDPRLHEAIEEVEGGGKPGMVVEELQRGYRRNDEVLRPARVKVSKSKQTQ